MSGPGKQLGKGGGRCRLRGLRKGLAWHLCQGVDSTRRYAEYEPLFAQLDDDHTLALAD